MKTVVFVTRLFLPHVGGAENQIAGLSKVLHNRGYETTVITERYDLKLKPRENIGGVKVLRLSYPRIPVLGLFVIWLKMFGYLKYFRASDLIHSFDSFVWIIPIRFIFFWKNFYSTMFGWEGRYPIPIRYKLLRKIAKLLSKKTIADAGFIEKYYGVRADKLRYASYSEPIKTVKLTVKSRNIVYVGRLDEDTGLKEILKGLSYLRRDLMIDFCGDGPLFKECNNYGKVHGFVNPVKYYEKSQICLSSGHTSIIEAFFYKCLIITAYDNQLKKDYLLMTPFKDWIVVEKDPEKLAEKIMYYLDHPEKAKPMIDAAYEWVQGQTWEKMADTYEELWGFKKSKI